MSHFYLSKKDIDWIYTFEDNSIAVIVKHMVENMLSTWTNFHMEDGEKEWTSLSITKENSKVFNAQMFRK